MAIQTILISNNVPLKDQQKWLRAHGYAAGVDKKPEFNRFRQVPPRIGARYRTITKKHRIGGKLATVHYVIM